MNKFFIKLEVSHFEPLLTEELKNKIPNQSSVIVKHLAGLIGKKLSAD